jgi:L-aminopeptidase/D-esterase-like protein
VNIGHWTRADGKSGCTVLLFDSLSPAAVDVRGGAPGTRETDLLRADMMVQSVDAIVLTGGSAYGLATADGVMRYLRERGRGFQTTAGPVPIVPVAVIYDLESESFDPPDAFSGYQACERALPPGDNPAASWSGAGSGASYGALWGLDGKRRGGIGVARQATPFGTVTAVLVVNAAGGPTSYLADLAGLSSAFRYSREAIISSHSPKGSRESTTIGVVHIEGSAPHALLQRCAISAQDALARAIWPAHTLYDGDVFFAVADRRDELPREAWISLPIAAEISVEQAIAAVVAKSG